VLRASFDSSSLPNLISGRFYFPFSVDFILSHLLISMRMGSTANCARRYAAAKEELSDLIEGQFALEKRIVSARQSVQKWAAICRSKGIQIQPSSEASYLLRHSTLADEIRAILKFVSPDYVRPYVIKSDLERLGHDLSKYQNPQSTIQMVLKRMTDSGEVQEGAAPENGKKAYRVMTFNYDDILTSALDELRDKHIMDK